MKLYLCEKPSQAKDIARVLGVTGRKDGFIEGNNQLITWGFGHLLKSCNPEVYHSDLADFGNIESLPVIPEHFKMTVPKDKKKQVEIIRNLLKKATEVVIATDADREGEVIARELLEYLNYKGKLSRLWLQSLDDASIKKALNTILPGSSKESLYQAGLARSHADWLVGMNLSRIYTKAYGQGYGKAGVLSIGRVQTPTLFLVVERDRIIENFKPYEYYGFRVVFQTSFDDGRKNTEFETIWQIPDALKNDDGYCVNKKYIEELAEIISKNDTFGSVVSSKTERKKESAPLPYSLSELQKEASKRFGVSPAKVLEVAQSLYEKYKVTSYPRTPCQYLPESQKGDVPVVLSAVAKLNPDLVAIIQKTDPDRDARVWNDNQVNKASHHAIIPTIIDQADITGMTKLEKDIYRMIVLRYIAQFYPDYEYDSTIIVVSCADELFRATGTIPRFQGWKAVLGDPDSKKSDKTTLLPPVEETDTVCPLLCSIQTEKTTPPPHYTEASLLDEMKTLKSISKRLESDPKLKKIAKETQGLGTEATRANILDRLLEVGYLEKNKKKQLVSTEKGRSLIGSIPPEIADPVTTAKWELSLAAIENGTVTYERFMSVHKKTITNLVNEAKTVVAARPQSKFANTPQKKHKDCKPGEKCPECGTGDLILREKKGRPEEKYLGCSNWKFDRSGCNFYQRYRNS